MNIDELNELLVSKRKLRDEFNKDIAEAIRNCGRAILAAHKDDLDKARSMLSAAMEIRSKYRPILNENPWMYSTLIHLEQELVEATAFIKYVESGKFIERDHQVFPEAYVLGMADLIGELRRRAIELVRRGHIEEAFRILEDMEYLYVKLWDVDYTAVKELRHKLDGYRRSITALKEELVLIKNLRKG